MSKHIAEWLNAYLDGELNISRLPHVEAHLAECQVCRAELESLERVSGLLHEVSPPEFTSPERFAAQVNLRLPHRPVAATRRRLVEVSWCMAPVGLLMIWVFISTTLLISDMVSAANNFGLLDSPTALLVSDTPDTAYWTFTLRQFGLLEGTNLLWAETGESFTRTVVPQIVWQVSIALLYLTWIAIWWARRTRQGHGQLLEG